MAAVRAFDGAGRVLRRHNDAFNFAQLRSSKHSPKARNAPSMPRKRSGEGVQLAELLKLNLQETSRLPVNQCHPKTRMFGKNRRERPEMKPAIHKQLGRRGDRRQVELLPQIPRTASKNGLRTRLIAVQFLSHAEYLFKVVNSLPVASMQP